ncbi:anoctamin-9 isoform X2 [Erinaceus europaeus]|uniref:Anoctamin n=1 Tax=Erinaceus europaeus TaxID=9365 RepID=A0ABM3W5Z4_ERIEU|nr:anoctamin-9 isoform X2 [Erinaceus europaeus]
MQDEERALFSAGTQGDSALPMKSRGVGMHLGQSWLCCSLSSPVPGPGPHHEDPEHCDYVLVANTAARRKPGLARKQQQFLKELRMKGFRVKEVEDGKKVFFGIWAEKSVSEQYCMLLETQEATPITTRIRIFNFILNSELGFTDTFQDLVKCGVFETSFPLHQEEKKKFLKKEWACWTQLCAKKQPIDSIRDYFGEKVALYFAWLGWYTCMLIPAAGAGLLIFLSGFFHFNASQISKEICSAHDIFMCPRGDHSHKFQRLSDTCTFAKLTHLFDNEGTVAFAIFMALWATVFLEFWKRKRAQVVQHWDLYGWDEEEEEMALALINSPHYQLKQQQHSYLRSTAILLLSLLMICLMIGMAHLLVVYRVLAAAAFGSLDLPFLQVTTAVVVTGALVHYMMILIMTKLNKYVALKLCDLEQPRTFSERESKFTIKFFTLQFFAHFSSLIYIAFILGRINGHPGKSVRLAGQWKLEECHLSGCMMDLFVQMAVIMGLKQTLSNCVEYLSPWLTLKWRSMQARWDRPADPELQVWRQNYRLNSVYTFSLFDEFMEMMIQYGFTTIFVAAFPLAPLLAFFSNLVETRLDAIKMLRLQRCLVPRKAKDIGTWLQVLEIIGVLAVIANGMVIAFTSDFIPRVVYKYHYGPCRRGTLPGLDCLTGYINHSLSVFHTKDLPISIKGTENENVTECRYRDYRNSHNYNFSKQFWVLLAIRLAFLILFEHVALCIKLIAAWFVPDVPQSVKNKVLEQKYERLRKMMRPGLQRPPGSPLPPSCSLRSTAV